MQIIRVLPLLPRNPIKRKGRIAVLSLDKIYHASYVLKNVIRPTDLIYAPNINPESQIYSKTENLQVTGSFKVRGAYYKISQLSDEEKAQMCIRDRYPSL